MAKIKEELLQIRISKDLKQKVEFEAEKLEKTMAEFVRDAINDKLRRSTNTDSLFWEKLGTTLRERATIKGVDLSLLGFLADDLPALEELMPENKGAKMTLHSILSTAFNQMNKALETLPERAGTIKFNKSNRFEIRTSTGWTDELTCGTGVSVLFNGQWIDTSVEYSDKKGGYYFTTPALQLREGIIAVLTRYK